MHGRIMGWAAALGVVLGQVLAVPVAPAAAQDRAGFAAPRLTGLARLVPGDSRINDRGDGIGLRLTLSQGVPWRLFTLAGPPRLVLDFREVDWRDADPAALDRAARVTGVRMGAIRPGWSRLVLDLDGPYLPRRAGLTLDDETGRARLSIALDPAPAEDFAAAAGVPDLPGWDLPPPPGSPPRPVPDPGGGDMVVVLDPGHGGVDPGAMEGGITEKALMLRFARELRMVLLRAGGFRVVLTRRDDRFVSLERRVAVANRAEADVFVSLHADVMSDVRVRGASVYTLSDSASDAASAALAERHNRADMLAGIDLSGLDDVVADVLMDLARLETQPRAEALAESLVAAIRQAELPLISRPHRQAGFSVLKSADIPSVLIELGFLSDPRDRANLTDAAWRARMAAGIRDALAAWRDADAVRAGLVRQ